MSYSTPEGAKFQYSTTFAGALNVTAATNAAESVLSVAAHGLVTDDEFLFMSGWEDANQSVFRANNLSAGTLGAKSLDTSSTVFYPAGSGVGTIQKISGWLDIPQVLGINADGGDAKFTSVEPLSSRNGLQIPVGFNPGKTTLSLGYDPTNATYKAMLALGRNYTKVALRIIGGGGAIYGYGYMSTSEVPKMSKGNVNTVDCVLSFQGRTIGY